MRADERPDHASADAWLVDMRAHGVDTMGNGFVFGVQRADGRPPTGRAVAIDGGAETEDLSLLAGCGAAVRDVIAAVRADVCAVTLSYT